MLHARYMVLQYDIEYSESICILRCLAPTTAPTRSARGQREVSSVLARRGRVLELRRAPCFPHHAAIRAPSVVNPDFFSTKLLQRSPSSERYVVEHGTTGTATATRHVVGAARALQLCGRRLLSHLTQREARISI